MPTPEEMTATVHAYVDAFERGDPEAVRDIFAEDAVVEDPVGTPPHEGMDAIVAFYTASMQTGPKLTLEGPVRTAANFAAFAFSVTFAQPGMQVDVIDTFEFDDAGKVKHMRAFFGPQNMQGFEGFFGGGGQ